MSERQISELAGALTRHQNHFSKMSTDDRQWAIQNTEAAVDLFASAVKNRAGNVVKKLLDFVTTVGIVGIASFVAAEKFRLGKTIDGIKVGWLGDNFKAGFLSKIEEQTPALEIREHELLKNSRDPAIITELGGEENVEITLGQFWEFLKTADRRFWYVAYIRDTKGVLWAVYANWGSGSLYVGADSLGSPDEWSAGYRFLSRCDS